MYFYKNDHICEKGKAWQALDPPLIITEWFTQIIQLNTCSARTFTGEVLFYANV